MHLTQVFCAVLALASYASAIGYGMGGGLGGVHGGGLGGYGAGGGYAGFGGYGVGAGHGGGSGYGGAHGGYAGHGAGQIYAPKPYNFAYDAPDAFGNAHFRREQGDGSGAVQGSYGYTDTQGLYRQVDYVADAAGFRASVKTNEPGTDGKESPADVNVQAQPPPAGVQERYTRVHGGGAHGGAYGGGYGAGHGGIGHGGAGGYGHGLGGGYGAGGFGGLGKYGGAGGAGFFGGVSRSFSGKSGY